jgi:hypothetical protein
MARLIAGGDQQSKDIYDDMPFSAVSTSEDFLAIAI